MAIKYKTGSHEDGKREMTMEEFARWLKTFDKDKDGRISREELRQAVRAKGGCFSGWKSKRGLKSADSNGNGFIDIDEIPRLKEFAEKELHVKIVAY